MNTHLYFYQDRLILSIAFNAWDYKWQLINFNTYSYRN
ncbi:hypothetical protein ACFW04_004674 [Cataglyphis niger]